MRLLKRRTNTENEVKMKDIVNKAVKLFFSVIRSLSEKLFHAAGHELTEEKWATIEQFIKFCFVGATNAAISYITHCVVLFFIEGKVPGDYLISSTCGFILSVLNAFILNNRFVFKAEHTSKLDIAKALLKTFASYASTGLLLNYVLLYLLCDCLGMSKYIAPLVVMAVTTPVNFILNKFWAFRKKKTSDDK